MSEDYAAAYPMMAIGIICKILLFACVWREQWLIDVALYFWHGNVAKVHISSGFCPALAESGVHNRPKHWNVLFKPQIYVSLTAFLPGSYASFLLYAACRRWEGYKFDHVPSYDDWIRFNSNCVMLYWKEFLEWKSIHRMISCNEHLNRPFIFRFVNLLSETPVHDFRWVAHVILCRLCIFEYYTGTESAPR